MHCQPFLVVCLSLSRSRSVPSKTFFFFKGGLTSVLKYCVHIWCVKDAALYKNSHPHRLVNSRPKNLFLFFPDKDEYSAVYVVKHGFSVLRLDPFSFLLWVSLTLSRRQPEDKLTDTFPFPVNTVNKKTCANMPEKNVATWKGMYFSWQLQRLIVFWQRNKHGRLYIYELYVLCHPWSSCFQAQSSMSVCVCVWVLLLKCISRHFYTRCND